MVDFIKFKKTDYEDSEEGPKKQKRDKTRFKFTFTKLFLWFVIFFLLSSIISTISLAMSPKIAVVPINGAIMTGGSGGSLMMGDVVDSRAISEELYGFLDDSSIKAIILDINSPGGSPVASEEVSRAIDAVRESGVPVYAVINDLGASGAFWIAMSAEKVYASKMSTVGSIGVTSAGLSFENFIRDYNITYRKQTAGEFKDMGSPFREPTVEEEVKVQKILDEVHKEFILHVAKARNKSFEEVSEFATGEIFLGSFAKDSGFVDEIGNYRDVVVDLKEIVGEDVLVMNYGPTKGIFSKLGVLSSFSGVDSKSQILLK